jgi:type III pantothenate kinase
MNILCMSVRDQRTTFGLFEGDELADHWRVSTDQRRTADEWGLLVRGLTRSESGSSAADVTGLCISSTVPAVLHELRVMTRTYFSGAHTVVVGPGVKTGLPVQMDNPREVGTDRVANAVAASSIWRGPLVVVDLGTAITFEVVDAEGRYVGGLIAPGVDVSVAALRERGAQLRQVEIERPRFVVAKNTIEALQSGAVNGFAGLVDGVVERIAAELGDGITRVVATGDLDSAVVDACTSITDREPFLTLRGLRLIYERNTA